LIPLTYLTYLPFLAFLAFLSFLSLLCHVLLSINAALIQTGLALT
jgi:hypothetical protein